LASAFRRLIDNIAKGVSSSHLDADIYKLASDLVIRHAKPGRIEQPANVSPHGPEKKARDFLESRFDRPITLSALSRVSGLSQFYLQRRFLKSMGCSPKEYLLQHRIKVARQLLIKGLPLSQVALETGFYDQGHFTNRFKTVMGVTPGAFSAMRQPCQWDQDVALTTLVK
jgi:AraC-like DNA-binding protein